MSNRGLENLASGECEELLRTHTFGRVVTKIGDTISAFPVYFRFVDGSIVFRTDPGMKLAAAVLRTRVAFEVDDEAEGWSVMASGQCEEVRASDELASLLEVLAGTWPDGERQRVVRIRAERISGRRLRPVPH